MVMQVGPVAISVSYSLFFAYNPSFTGCTVTTEPSLLRPEQIYAE